MVWWLVLGFIIFSFYFRGLDIGYDKFISFFDRGLNKGR